MHTRIKPTKANMENTKLGGASVVMFGNNMRGKRLGWGGGVHRLSKQGYPQVIHSRKQWVVVVRPRKELTSVKEV